MAFRLSAELKLECLSTKKGAVIKRFIILVTTSNFSLSLSHHLEVVSLSILFRRASTASFWLSVYVRHFTISSIVRLHPTQISSSFNLHKAIHGDVELIKLLFYLNLHFYFLHAK